MQDVDCSNNSVATYALWKHTTAGLSCTALSCKKVYTKRVSHACICATSWHAVGPEGLQTHVHRLHHTMLPDSCMNIQGAKVYLSGPLWLSQNLLCSSASQVMSVIMLLILELLALNHIPIALSSAMLCRSHAQGSLDQNGNFLKWNWPNMRQSLHIRCESFTHGFSCIYMATQQHMCVCTGMLVKRIAHTKRT